MRRRLGAASALLLAALAAAMEAPAAGQQSSCVVVPGEWATVGEVIDGDTLVLAGGTIVRLAGVEAPKRPLTVPGERSWPPAEASRSALVDMLAGESVGLARTGEGGDRYGRVHAYVALRDGRLAQAEQVARGHARVRWLPEETSCFQWLVAMEDEAREARLGLWASQDYATRSAHDPSLVTRNGLYELVEGQVVSIGHGSRMIFLDFGRHFRSDFTVMVPPRVAEGLTADGRPADDFLNRRVRVRGVVEESGGPAIRLNDPAEIEFID